MSNRTVAVSFLLLIQVSFKYTLYSVQCKLACLNTEYEIVIFKLTFCKIKQTNGDETFTI